MANHEGNHISVWISRLTSLFFLSFSLNVQENYFTSSFVLICICAHVYCPVVFVAGIIFYTFLLHHDLLSGPFWNATSIKCPITWRVIHSQCHRLYIQFHWIYWSQCIVLRSIDPKKCRRRIIFFPWGTLILLILESFFFVFVSHISFFTCYTVIC